MDIHFCPNCDSDLEDQYGYDPSFDTWTCTECGQFLMNPDLPEADGYPDVSWFCDNCNALLNRQIGFVNAYETWTCTECGYTNGITDDDVWEDEHKCPECDANLKKQKGYSKDSNDYTCFECGSLLHRDYCGDRFSVIDDKDKCPDCGSYLKNQIGFNDYYNDWTCTECDAELHREYGSDTFEVVPIEHKCPNCGECLLKQSEYSEDSYDWICTECDSKLHRDYSDSEFEIIERNESDSSDDNEDTVEEYTSNENSNCNSSSYRSSIYKSDYSHQSGDANSNGTNIPDMLSKKEVRKKRAKAFFLKKKLIPVGYSSESLRMKSAEEINVILHNCGFKKINQVIKKDICDKSSYRDNEVSEVKINGESKFNTKSEFPYDSEVVIVIHQKKEIKIPFSSSTLRKLKYKDVYSKLSSLGFTKIYPSPIRDLITGWLKKDGKIDSIIIDEKSKFKKNTVFKYDVNISIKYHTFKRIKK